MSLSGKGKIIRKKVALILYDVCVRMRVCVCAGEFMDIGRAWVCVCVPVLWSLWTSEGHAHVCVCVCVCWGVYGHQKGQKKHVTPRGLADQRLRLRLCNTRIYEMMGVN